MPSTITPRIGGAVNATPVNTGGGGIIQAINVAGGPNVITAGTSPQITQYSPNQLFMIRPPMANTGAVTVDFGPGVKPWRKPAGGAFAAGDLSNGLDYLIKLSADMSEFRTVSPF